MKLLAIETATEACSAALYWDGAIVERFELAPQRHNRLILSMIESLLAEAGSALSSLTAVGFGRGPGSFTGVRIAASVTQGLAFGADLPVVPVSTLAALAQQVFDESDIPFAFPCLDARMREVYWGVYARDACGLAVPVSAERVLAPAGVSAPLGAMGVGLGSGWGSYAAVLCAQLGNQVCNLWEARFPAARQVAKLAVEGWQSGQAVPAELALPVYLRDDVARKPGEASPPK